MQDRHAQLYKSLILYAIWMTVLAVVILWAAYLVRDVLLLIYISGLLAIGFSPTVRLIERQKILPVGTQALSALDGDSRPLSDDHRHASSGSAFSSCRRWSAQARQLVDRDAEDARSRVAVPRSRKGILDHPITGRKPCSKRPAAGSSDAVGTVVGAVAGVVGGVFGFLTILILTFYLLVEADQLRSSMLRLFPRRRRTKVAAASADITFKVSAWLGGQLLLGGIIGVTSAIGLWLMGVPFFYVLALISGIGEMIPVVGPVLAAIPAVAVAATVSYEKAMFVLDLLRDPAAVRESRAGAEGHGTPGGRQRRDRDHRPDDRRELAGHPRRHPRRPDRGDSPGAVHRADRAGSNVNRRCQ